MKAFTKANIKVGKQHLMCIGFTPDDSLYFVLGKKCIMMMLEFAKLPKLGLSFNSKSYTTFLIRLTCGTL
jgi:hypothetical protein